MLDQFAICSAKLAASEMKLADVVQLFSTRMDTYLHLFVTQIYILIPWWVWRDDLS